MLDRALAFLLLAALAVMATLAIGLGLGALAEADIVIAAEVVERLAVESGVLSPVARLLLAAGGGLVLVVTVLLLWRVVHPAHEAPAPYLVTQDALGVVTITPSALNTVAEVVGRSFRGFQALECSTQQTETGDVAVRCRLRMHPEAKLAADAASFREQLRTELEQRTGLQVALVDVEMSYGQSTVRRRVS